MELEHRFELPVDIDTAWATLTDIEQVGPCFPGAKISSVNGDEFTGSVRLKVGPARLTYEGRARFVGKDAATHTAHIEATGTEGSLSTAAMLVTATATAVSTNRTRVDLVTTLSLTGRPAAFARPIMVEVGNKLISSFADCVSTKLTGQDAGGAVLLDVDNPDEIAAEREAALSAPKFGVDTTSRYVSRAAGGSERTQQGGPRSVGAFVSVALGIIGAILLRKLLRRNNSDG